MSKWVFFKYLVIPFPVPSQRSALANPKHAPVLPLECRLQPLSRREPGASGAAMEAAGARRHAPVHAPTLQKHLKHR